jgi:NadR type nicotinamide-nucleotide adenylyltransferase
MTPLTRVVVTGSESTGKTTLAAQLAAHFGVPSVGEYVRAFAAAKGAPLVYDDHAALARGQTALEDAGMVQARAHGHSLLVHDTDLLSTVVYHWHYHGKCERYLEEAAQVRRPELYLLLDIDVPWVPDGIRDRGTRREEVQALFVETLERCGAPYVRISGSWQERFAAAVHAIEQVLLPHH